MSYNGPRMSIVGSNNINSMSARRPSKLSHIVAANHGGSPSSSMPTAPTLYESVPHFALRLPSLFRTRIPLIAVLPFFLLGFLFAPIHKFDPEEPGYHANGGDGRAVRYDTTPEGEVQARASWAQRFFSSAMSKSTNGGANQGLNEHYTENDGLLYFAPSASENDALEGVSAARASQPKQRHPILYLMEKAESAWEDMLNRQSTTLEAAVNEYTRRYSRPPPRGFEKWWDFAQKNSIELVDEYDSITRDIEPFLALPPQTLKARNSRLSNGSISQSFTINVRNGQPEISGPLWEMDRANEIRDLLAGFTKSLPDMDFTFTAHDGPGLLLAGEVKERYIETARAGRVLREDDLEKDNNPAEYPGFTAACLPNSNWRKSLSGWSLPKPSTHSFVTDVEESSDVCQHPNLASQHGFFLWNGPYMVSLNPVFTWAKTLLHSDILATPLEQYHYPVGPDPEWEDKRFDKVLWRGSNTGAAFTRESRWRSSQRARLVLMTDEQEGNRLVHWADRDGTLRASTEPVVDINERYTDIAFSGRPGQCDEGDGTCDALSRIFKWHSGMGQEEANNYKYIFDMDGNGWSGRFHRLMMSNSAILKSTMMPEWYQSRIMPWVHFIPVKVDYTDLYDILAFFIGGPDGENGHGHLGRKIGLQGQEWAKHHWRVEDMQAYMFRLLLEFARLLTRTEDDLTAGDYQDENV